SSYGILLGLYIGSSYDTEPAKGTLPGPSYFGPSTRMILLGESLTCSKTARVSDSHAHYMGRPLPSQEGDRDESIAVSTDIALAAPEKKEITKGLARRSYWTKNCESPQPV
ncbi:unnamed protein product, partial [Fusarium graminearum]